ncbi:YchJ family protein [Ferrimonas sp. SCSIO 43195]|uniref:YchJ family protein n=1 Tax=Ferrimonas sp. SCSIO 43195 TaxID=2822844 RepID=UPI0020760FBE|nr:YchJ family metal-binding protein [Ferrimonas sp. SCSIO 43195]USD39305.1 SEC-C domain-containing protein [Ferrimonas sp. SCSIO 43195]
MSHCQCGSNLAYRLCCQPLHCGDSHASSPEQLMRSRYCAFVEGKADYLLATHHPQYRASLTVEQLADSCRDSDFVGLQIVDVPADSGDQGEVEFKAWYRQGSEILALWERSRFQRLEDRWHYCDGDIQPLLKLGRNDPCPCGSGKKAKKCCL